MNCAFCGNEFNDATCCDRAAMNKALIALRYHTECGHAEVTTAILALEARKALYEYQSRTPEERSADWEAYFQTPQDRFVDALKDPTPLTLEETKDRADRAEEVFKGCN